MGMEAHKITEYADRIIQGDVLDVLPQLPAGIAHCCVTSPPYWALRSYLGKDHPDKPLELGSEKTPQEYVEKMVSVFREVRRVLRDDGVLWVNIGDSYTAKRSYQISDSKHKVHDFGGANAAAVPPGLKEKELVGIPWLLAFALQADGWWLRSEVIWHKPGPMPDSVNGWRWERHRVKVKPSGRGGRGHQHMLDNPRTNAPGDLGGHAPQAEWRPCPGCPKCNPHDGHVLRKGSWRCTVAHEHVFQFAKSKSYFADREAVKEESSETSGWATQRAGGINTWKYNDTDERRAQTGQQIEASTFGQAGTRNKRSVWTISTKGYKEAHFACVDMGTECLTPEGWRCGARLLKETPIAAFDGVSLSWQPATFHVYPYKGEMVRIRTRDLSMFLTANHRVVRRNYRRRRPWSIRRADTLVSQDMIPTAAPWAENGTATPGPTLAYAEMAGWVLTDGGYNSGQTITIYQTQGRGKHERIERLLETLAIEARTKVRHRHGRRENEYSFGGPVAAALRKDFPYKEPRYSILLTWPAKALRCLWNGMVAGDGHTRQDGRIHFVGSRLKVDFFQALSLRLGITCRVTPRRSGAWDGFVSHKRSVSLRGTNGKGGGIGWADYHGQVWCPSVATGMWLARKDGRPFITGNTFPEALIEPMILSSTSAKGCCPECGSQYAPVIDSERVATRPAIESKTYIKPPVHPESPVRTHAGDVCGNRDPERHCTETIVKGYWPTCECDAGESVPCIVLDPFMGAGTTGLVAKRMGRDFVGVELNQEYVDMANRRLRQTLPLLMGGKHA